MGTKQGRLLTAVLRFVIAVYVRVNCLSLHMLGCGHVPCKIGTERLL